MVYAMNLHIDKAGRLVLPKSVRSQFGITPDTPLELIQSADGILLRPVAERPSMQLVDGLWVHQGVCTTKVEWNSIVDDIREERAESAWAP